MSKISYLFSSRFLRSFAANKTRPHRIRVRPCLSVAKIAVLCLLTAVLCLPAWAGGFSKTYSLSTGTVTVENTQKRSSWAPVAILIHYTAPVDTTITIKRINNGNEYLLSTVTLTGVQDVTWIPDADYPFNFGDSLVISTTATDGTLELIQRSN